jgi:hypothetical protein
MPRQLVAAASSCLIALSVLAGPAIADEPVRGNILVLTQSVEPGGSFPVSGYGLDPGIEITFVLHQGPDSAEAGSTTVGADGTFTTTAVVPATFSNGYAELAGVGDGGARWVASVLIGPEPTPASQTVVVPSESRVTALIVFVVGLVTFVIAGVSYLRAQRQRSNLSG